MPFAIREIRKIVPLFFNRRCFRELQGNGNKFFFNDSHGFPLAVEESCIKNDAKCTNVGGRTYPATVYAERETDKCYIAWDNHDQYRQDQFNEHNKAGIACSLNGR